MQIGIIDAEITTSGQHRFPNLACMKIAAYYKQKGHDVELLTQYDQIQKYDQVYISCVFTETAEGIDSSCLDLANVEYGGTGFHYDKYDNAPTLNDIHPNIEHIMPDYSLYDNWVDTQQIWECKKCKNQTTTNETKDCECEGKLIKKNPSKLKYYTDFSIGFTTRGCPRGCDFCVNRNSKGSKHVAWADEFYNPSRKNICLLDDNLLACPQSDVILRGLTQKCKLKNIKFEYKQGLDMRLMTERTAKLLADSPYCGDYIFAFDNPADKDIIKKGLTIFRKYVPSHSVKFFVFCGYSNTTEVDIATVFERTRILWQHQALSYVMRHKNYLSADPLFVGIYVQLSRWCNQPNFQKMLTFRVFCNKSKGKSARVMNAFEERYPEIADKYFDMCYPFGGSAYIDPNYQDEWTQKIVNSHL